MKQILKPDTALTLIWTMFLKEMSMSYPVVNCNVLHVQLFAYKMLTCKFLFNLFTPTGKQILNSEQNSEVIFKEVYGAKSSRMDQVKFFKGCLPQISLGPFLNTLSHM